MEDGDQSICFVKQEDELLAPDGFKRAALKEKFLNTKIIFLKTKLLTSHLDLGRFSRLRTIWAALKDLCAPTSLQTKLVNGGWRGVDLDLESSLTGF